MSSWTDEISDLTLHTECVAIVSDCVRRLIEDEREWSDILHETIDGHRWIIYTGASQQLLAVSRFDGYAIEELGCTGIANGGGIHWAALAFGALIGQCYETDPDDETIALLKTTITTEDRNADLEGDETFADLLEILDAIR